MMSLPVSQLVFPNGSAQGPFLEQLVSEYTSQVVARFLARWNAGGHLRGCDPALVDALSARADALDYDTVWDPSFGGIYAAALGNGDRAVEKLACVGLRLHELGCAGSWSAEISEQVGLRFDQWPLPACDRIEVEATPSDVCITARRRGAAREVRFARRAGEWDCETPDVPRLPAARVADARVIVLRRRELWSDEVADIASEVDDAAPELMASRAERALDRLRRLSSGYYRWVARVVRFIAPRRVESNYRPTGSSSSSFAPGLVGVGNHDHAASLAESLVHEASHHYFYCAMRLGAVDDGSDTNLYYNPFFGRDRPIGLILFAYHAFANVLRLCRAALADGDVEYFEPREREVARGLAVMETALHGNRALTPLGELIWRDLHRCAHDE